jgi:hypothetical protein
MARWWHRGSIAVWIGLALVPTVAVAAVDLNGRFRGEVIFPGGSCNFDVTQVGTAITID